MHELRVDAVLVYAPVVVTNPCGFPHDAVELVGVETAGTSPLRARPLPSGFQEYPALPEIDKLIVLTT